MAMKQKENVLEVKTIIVSIIRVNPVARDIHIGKVLNIDPRTITKYREEIEKELREILVIRELDEKSKKIANNSVLEQIKSFLRRI